MALPDLSRVSHFKPCAQVGFFVKHSRLREKHGNILFDSNDAKSVAQGVTDRLTDMTLLFIVPLMRGIYEPIWLLYDNGLSSDFLSLDVEGGEGPDWWEDWVAVDDKFDASSGVYVVHYQLRFEWAGDGQGSADYCNPTMDDTFRVHLNVRTSYYRSYWSRQYPRNEAYPNETPRPELLSRWCSLEKDDPEKSLLSLRSLAEYAFAFELSEALYEHPEIAALKKYLGVLPFDDKPNCTSAEEALSVYGVKHLVFIGVLQRIKSLVAVSIDDMDVQRPDGPSYVQSLHEVSNLT